MTSIEQIVAEVNNESGNPRQPISLDGLYQKVRTPSRADYMELAELDEELSSFLTLRYGGLDSAQKRCLLLIISQLYLQPGLIPANVGKALSGQLAASLDRNDLDSEICSFLIGTNYCDLGLLERVLGSIEGKPEPDLRDVDLMAKAAALLPLNSSRLNLFVKTLGLLLKKSSDPLFLEALKKRIIFWPIQVQQLTLSEIDRFSSSALRACEVTLSRIMSAVRNGAVAAPYRSESSHEYSTS